MENKYREEAQAYYYSIDSEGVLPSENNFSSDEVPLMVNCCGIVVLRDAWAHRYARFREDYYLIYSLGGDMVGRLDGGEIRIKSGQAICIRPGTSYIFSSLEPIDESTRYYWIHFTGSDVEPTLRRSGIETNCLYDILPTSDLYFHYEQLFEAFRARPTDFEYASELPLRNILLLLGRSRRDAGRVRRLDNSIRYIHTHLRSDLSVEKLAAMEFLGVSRYRELFREAMGTSPSDYVTRLRIRRAADLIWQTDMSINEIAESVGYDNRNYFQNVFKKITGSTPGEYRKQLAK